MVTLHKVYYKQQPGDSNQMVLAVNKEDVQKALTFLVMKQKQN